MESQQPCKPTGLLAALQGRGCVYQKKISKAQGTGGTLLHHFQPLPADGPPPDNDTDDEEGERAAVGEPPAGDHLDPGDEDNSEDDRYEGDDDAESSEGEEFSDDEFED
jgi:hypothetical protein